MSDPKMDFDEDKARSQLLTMAGQELSRFANMAAQEIRNGAPGGRSGRMARGVRVFKNDTELVIYIPHPGKFLEFGHDVVINGRKAGHAPARPFVRPAIMRAAARFGESYGGAVGEFAGSTVGSSLGPIGSRILGRWGRRAGAKKGRDVWTRAGAKLADMVEAKSLREAAGHGVDMAADLASEVTAKRGSL